MSAELWPKIRAALIAALLLSQCIDATPMPVLRKDHLEYGKAKRELRNWTKMLNGMGVETSEQQVLAKVVALSKQMQKIRSKVMWPLRPLRKLAGVQQKWKMFAVPDKRPGRLVLAARQNGEWHELYHSPEKKSFLLEEQLFHRRVRAIYDDGGDRPRIRAIFIRFADWVAWNIFQEYPQYDAVMVRIDKSYVELPNEEPQADRLLHQQSRGRQALLEKMSRMAR